MTGWQVTAKTIYCESVDDEVTFLVNKDGTSRCTGFRKYTQPNDITAGIVKEKRKSLKRQVKCEGEGCARLTDYKDQSLAEKTA
jgi:hypothetical protein